MASITIFNSKKIVLLSVMIFVLSLSSIPMQSSFAASRTISVGEDQTVTITYRDIENPEPTPEPVLSLDKTLYRIGETVILTIDDFNANLDLTNKDNISVLVNSQPVQIGRASCRERV